MPRINLNKGGGAICLDKGLSQITVGIGWYVIKGGEIDIDACIAGLTADSKLLQDEWFIITTCKHQINVISAIGYYGCLYASDCPTHCSVVMQQPS